MIAFLKGEVAAVSENQLILDVNDVGYQIAISSRDAAALPPIGATVKVYTYLNISTDAISLVGFLSEDDLEIYRMMLKVNGIGPKAGLGILSTLSADDIRFAVLSDDAKAIARAPGVGSKTAQKLILELKDKLNLEDAVERSFKKPEKDKSGFEEEVGEAVQALVALGYSSSDALRAVRKVEIASGMDTEAVLKLALKNLL